MPKKINLLKYSIITLFVITMGILGFVQIIKLLAPQPLQVVRTIDKKIDESQLEIRKEGGIPLPPPPQQHIEVEARTKFNIAGIMNIEIGEETSWQTVLKLMVTVLGTFFGINLINRFFKKWA